MNHNRFLFSACIISLFLVISCATPSHENAMISDSLRSQAISELRYNLRTLNKWEKVHAAEYLLWAGHPEGVRETFREEERAYGFESPYRIGIWRVLAQAASTSEEKEAYVEKILDAFRDPDGPDRLHAVETLAKLNIPVLERAPESAQRILEGETNSLYVYTLWSASIQDSAYQRHKDKFLKLVHSDTSGVLRLQAAYSLRNLGGLSDAQWEGLADRALTEPAESMVSAYLLSAAWFTASQKAMSSDKYAKVHAKIREAKDSPMKGARMELAHAFAEQGSAGDLPVLLALLNNENPINSNNLKEKEKVISSPENADVRSAAAYAILKSGQRGK